MKYQKNLIRWNAQTKLSSGQYCVLKPEKSITVYQFFPGFNCICHWLIFVGVRVKLSFLLASLVEDNFPEERLSWL